jgi:hypothetical protein
MDPLASPEDLATFLRHDVDTAAAELMLASASAAIRNYCRWEISETLATDVTLDTDGDRIVMLPALHVTAVNSVTLDDIVLDPDLDYSWSVMGAIYRKHHVSTIRAEWDTDWYRHCGWPAGFRRLVVNYDGGYNPVPGELIVACCSIAARGMLPLGATQYQEIVGGITVNAQYRTNAQNAKLMGSEQILLDRYRIPLAA